MQTKSKRLGLILNSTQIYNFKKKNLVHFLLVHAGNVWMTTAITHQSIFSIQTSFRVATVPEGIHHPNIQVLRHEKQILF